MGNHRCPATHFNWGEIPLISTSFCKRVERPSATNKKIKGDRGSPCLSPQVGENASNSFPLNLIEYLTVVTHAIIHVSIGERTPFYAL
jgi:hypothetical protein